MTDKIQTHPTRYYGLPNGAAKAYFVCQKYLNNGQNALFVTSCETDDFDSAAREFAPRGAPTLTPYAACASLPPGSWRCSMTKPRSTRWRSS